MENQQEIWKEIPGYEGHFLISNFGRIKSCDRFINHPRGGIRIQKGIIMKCNYDSHGYLLIRLVKNRIGKTFRVHRLVLLSFVGDSSLYVDHINNIPHDNRLQNLRYVTAKENAHYYRKLTNENWVQKDKKKPKEKYLNLPKFISFRKDTNKYSVRMTINNKYKSLGSFKSIKEAEEKIKEYKLKLKANG